MPIYQAGVNSLFWQLVENLADSHIFDKNNNVLPFTPLKLHTLVEFVPSLPMGTFVDVLINGNFLIQTKVLDNMGLVSVDFQLPYTQGVESRIDIQPTGTQNIATTTFFNTYNLDLFYGILGKLTEQKRVELLRGQGDDILITARDASLFPNFGLLFDLPKRFDQSFIQYRDVLSSFFIAFLNAATEKGIITAIKDLTGVEPIIQYFRNIHGWVIYDHYKYSVTSPFPAYSATDSFPAEEHMFIEDTIGAGMGVTIPGIGGLDLPPVEPFSTREKMFGAFIIMKQADITVTVTDEAAIKGSSGVGTDKFSSLHVTTDPVTITQAGSGPYTENTEFTIDGIEGTVTWTGVGNPPPAQGSIYLISYKLILSDQIVKVMNQLKPAFIKLVLKVLP